MTLAPLARVRSLVQNALRAQGASEWLVEGKNIGTSMALGSGLAESVGLNAGFGAGVAHDIRAGRYNEKHGINDDANRARIGHNGIPGAILSSPGAI